MRLRTGARFAVEGAGWAALASLSALALSGQSTHAGSTRELRMPKVPGQPQAIARASGEILREIEDPATGDRWLLVAGVRGGPGRLILAGHESNAAKGAGESESQSRRISGQPLIHAGDALIVEDHTAVADVRLEAVALGPAAEGAPFEARLKIGGIVVRVVLTAPGRALLAATNEGER